MQHGHRLPHWVNARVGRRRFLRLAWAGLAGGAIAPLLAACQGGPDAVAVAMTADDRFDPGSLTVPVGTQVVWHNASTERHTATDDPATAQD